jgi:hypothetical protein
MSRLQFDWTVNAGHVLTFLGFIITGFIAFQNLDKRVIVLEQTTAYQVRRDAEQDSLLKETKAEVRDALRDVRNSLEKLSDKIDKKR